jgi:anti-sigma factor RsiW
MFDESDFSMTRQQPSEELMIRYLLGELSEAERGEFERLCFDDDQAFEELLAVEAELTDDYVRGTLKGHRREQFEQHLLRSPARRDELALARLITQTPMSGAAPKLTSSSPARERSKWQAFLTSLGMHRQAWQFSLATVLIVAVGIGIWVLWTRFQSSEIASVQSRTEITPQSSSPPPANQEPQNSSQPVTTPPSGEKSGSADVGANQQPSSNNSLPTSRVPQNREPQSPATPRRFVPTFALVAGFERGEGGLNELKIPRGVDRIRLKINLAGTEHQTLSAALKRVEGQQILTRSNLNALPTRSGEILTLELPTSALAVGDYILTVNSSGAGGTETVARYFLRIIKP